MLHTELKSYQMYIQELS